MPLPFTGLQAFHWGDGVKVLFIFFLLAVVVITDDVVDGVDVEHGAGDGEVGALKWGTCHVGGHW